ncbi:MAG: glycine cleavage system protein H [Thermoanaerobaculia bacterium]
MSEPVFLEAIVDKFTFRVATDRLYAREGVWLQSVPGEAEAPVRLLVGVTDLLQQEGGDVAFARVVDPGTPLIEGQELAELETIKVNVAITSPIAATVLQVNEALASEPEILNQDPYGKGWLAVLEPTSWEADRKRFLDPRAYYDYMMDEVKREMEKR